MMAAPSTSWGEIDRRLYKPPMVGGCRVSLLDPWEPRPEPVHNHCSVISRDDIYKRVIRSELYTGTLELPIGAEMTKDTGGILEVTSIGPGRIVNGIQNQPLIEVGDIVYANLFYVGHRHMVAKRNHYFFDFDQMLARLDVETKVATPIGCNVITKPNPDRMQAAMIGGLVGTNGQQIILHGSSTDLGTNSEDSRDPQKIVYEEVVAVGPGRMEGGVFIKPTVEPGQLISFSKDRGVTTLTLKGQRLTMVPWSHVQAIIPG